MAPQELFENNPQRPQLHLQPGQVICPGHGAIFKPKWPTGYAPFVAAALDSLKECRCLDRLDGSVESIGTLLAERPICCRLADEDRDLLIKTYRTIADGFERQGSILWPRKKCNRCGRNDTGGPYTIPMPVSAHGKPRTGKHYPHLCLQCVGTIQAIPHRPHFGP